MEYERCFVCDDQLHADEHKVCRFCEADAKAHEQEHAHATSSHEG